MSGRYAVALAAFLIFMLPSLALASKRVDVTVTAVSAYGDAVPRARITVVSYPSKSRTSGETDVHGNVILGVWTSQNRFCWEGQAPNARPEIMVHCFSVHDQPHHLMLKLYNAAK